MSKLKIITVPSKVLRQKSSKIEGIDKSVKKLIKDLTETLREVGGLGIAAPQVGKLLRLIIIESKGGERKNGSKKPIIPLTVLINPEVVKCSKEKGKDDEGCLSVPELWAVVERPKSVTVKALNEKGKPIQIKAKDLFSRVLQHEIDHLNGILFTDKADLSTLHKIGPNGEIIKIKL